MIIIIITKIKKKRRQSWTPSVKLPGSPHERSDYRCLRIPLDTVWNLDPHQAPHNVAPDVALERRIFLGE